MDFFLAFIDKLQVEEKKQFYMFKQTRCSRGYICIQLNNSLSRSPFCSESSRYCASQTRRSKRLTFSENVYPPPCVTVSGRSTMVPGRSTMVPGRPTMVSGRFTMVPGRLSWFKEDLPWCQEGLPWYPEGLP